MSRAKVSQVPGIVRQSDSHEGLLLGLSGLWWFAEKAVRAD